jgi:hypothetical protein
LKPRFDFDFSVDDNFTALRTTACRRPAPVAFRRFACTRTGVVNPPPGAWVSAVAAALRHTRLRLRRLNGTRWQRGSRRVEKALQCLFNLFRVAC